MESQVRRETQDPLDSVEDQDLRETRETLDFVDHQVFQAKKVVLDLQDHPVSQAEKVIVVTLDLLVLMVCLDKEDPQECQVCLVLAE